MSNQFDAAAAGTMPQEKFEYTVRTFWPKIMGGQLKWMGMEDSVALCERVMDGAYDNYGPVKLAAVEAEEGVPPAAAAPSTTTTTVTSTEGGTTTTTTTTTTTAA